MSLVSHEVDSGMASAVQNTKAAKLSLSCATDTSNNRTLPNSASPPPLRSVTNHKAITVTGSVCAVCGDTAPKDTLFRRHYGIICCEACKCFFRRTVQMNRDYKCRYGNSCSVGRNPINVKQVCQACRFNHCLKAGMKVESVKRFPRKPRDQDSGKKEKLPREKPSPQRRPATKVQKVVNVSVTTNGTSATSPPPKVEKAESDLDLEETDLEHLKFNISSPESFIYSVLDSAVPQLFNYDSTENLHEKGLGSPAKALGKSREDLTRTSSDPNLLKAVGGSLPTLIKTDSSSSLAKRPAGEEGPLKRSGQDPQSSLQAKKQRIEYVLSNVAVRQPIGLHFTASPPQPAHVNSQSSSMVNSPESTSAMDMSAYNSQDTTPYATPHSTPAQTPVHSPLPSPSHAPPRFHHPTQHPPTFSLKQRSPGGPSLQPLGAFVTSSSPPSISTMNTINVPTFTQHTNNILLPSQPSTGAILLNPPSQMPFRVVPVAPVNPGPLLPLMQFTPFSQEQSTLIPSSGKSPFAIIPIPSINKAQPDSPPQVSVHSGSFTQDCDGMRSGPASARSSPVLGKSKSRAVLPEAELEEVLDSLRLRIRSMFKWAKSDVSGFEDLSPLDQKALLRRTVAELVMLGFARGSIAYDGMLLLGSTGKVIRSSNPNSGVATVASVTLQKLVVPLRVLNINDRELTLLKEVVLFNPESNGLRNREVVRQYRKRKHIELMEYTEKSSGEPGRFGELMCLLTPLFEVSMEVTEQLRLEQFVHEGEARIDALLLMSMINGAEETTESVADT